MSVVVEEDRVRLIGDCGIDDAESVMNYIQSEAGAQVDVSAATHMHAVIVQILLAHKPLFTGVPSDTFLAAWLIPALSGGGVSRPTNIMSGNWRLPTAKLAIDPLTGQGDDN
jgi:hypothetical protein